ncbi:DUF3598 family protein [Thermoleptolyngbya sichuanensis A183]|uniref:DUF3598 family protein n=1 Tax=Thermoleptolyngbya sichuanensis A183 TaxID=2737172 RepID=A0A6M8B5C0_9CYAN|nr:MULTISPECIES: DUF3598 family protein [Thermoleptolyngbya]QKD82164.1 DUF3598 family protein [Thermoleptolyngbya sichuanensis A183]
MTHPSPSPELSQWQCLLKNLGAWEGSFTRLSPAGAEVSSVPTVVTLEGLNQNETIRQTLEFGQSTTGDPPTTKVLEYSSLNRSTLFFETGAFSQGSLQFSPFGDFGAEFGLIAGNRRMRLVELFHGENGESRLSSLTLIRETLRGSAAAERPPLTAEQLVGTWQGRAVTLYPDWRSPETYSTTLSVSLDGTQLQQHLTAPGLSLSTTGSVTPTAIHFTQGSTPLQLLLLPDGASANTPLLVPKGKPFFLEAGWLISPTQRQRMIRRYDAQGGWESLTLVEEEKA